MTAKQLQKALSSSFAQVLLVAIAVIWTIPTLGLFISSFRPRLAIATSGWWTTLLHPLAFTQEITLENYQQVLDAGGMGNAFLNSLAVAIPATIIPITIAALAAYAFAWMKFPGRKWIFITVVGLLVLPLHMSLIPVLKVYTNLGLGGTYLAVWLAHTGFGMPLAIYLLYNFISTLPKEMMESAAIDGATSMQTFIRLVLPLSVPAMASLAIFQFLWVWNDFLVALVFLGGAPDRVVLTQRLASMVGERGQDWHILTAGAFITMLLPLAVFFSLQRYFVRGMMAGSVKG
ncbi:MAG: carbohydrate ABC transporter permease [Candidatus Promineifilaceae bacterium]|nr:carbohydrate ABC transporter permease [Candidatus Promineifilaceae bacterium]